ncbi:MAG TPA: glycoside hydrolase family 16 protein [Burkholderiales bacterium]|nr:glycoside hydrolase family 16 protein [Burkholderiales bacterium]
MAIDFKKCIFVSLLGSVGLLMSPTQSSAATYNAGISQVGFNNPTAQVGSALNPYAVIRNLSTRGIFTVYVDVMKEGESLPVRSFSCRTPELTNRAEYRCASSYNAATPGIYRVRARASSIGSASFTFPGNSAYPGVKTSSPLSVTDSAVTPPTAPPAPGTPTINEEFTANLGSWYTRLQPTGAVTFGVADAAAGDQKALALMFPGNPALSADANAWPAYASEVGFNQKTHYGRYETRVKFATCAPSEEVVNGIFIYHNDGTDKNGNGLKDNTEIDFELLCGEPNVLWLTTWTDYSGDEPNQFRKKSRAIDMRTGDYRETPKGQEGNYDTFPAGNLSEVRMTGFPQAGAYYTVGFDWYSNRIRWYIVINGKEVTLWDLTDTSVIPQNPATFMLNIWHSPTHWYTYDVGQYPDANSTMYVDYFRFTPFQ